MAERKDKPENPYDRQNRYNKRSTTMVALRLNLKTDADILERLSQVPSKMGYVKRLIREDMARERASEGFLPDQARE